MTGAWVLVLVLGVALVFVSGIEIGRRHAWVVWSKQVFEGKQLLTVSQSIMNAQELELSYWRKGMAPVRHVPCGEPITLRRPPRDVGVVDGLAPYCAVCEAFLDLAELSSPGPFSVLSPPTPEAKVA